MLVAKAQASQLAILRGTQLDTLLEDRTLGISTIIILTTEAMEIQEAMVTMIHTTHTHMVMVMDIHQTITFLTPEVTVINYTVANTVTEAMVVHNIAPLMELGTTWATMTMAIVDMVNQEMSTEHTKLSCPTIILIIHADWTSSVG